MQQKKGLEIAAQWHGLEAAIERSAGIRAGRLASIPPISYPDLPVCAKKDEIASAIRDHQVVIVCGETGSGKTTQIPKICLAIGRGADGMIGHTQPRRLAATTIAKRIAEELGQEVSGLIGYKIRFQDKVQPQTLVKLMTDGILLAEIQSDPFLNAYDTLILDEAHERSLNIDFLLGYLKWLLPKRPDLKVIVTSATIDPQRFSDHFNGAPIIEVSGRGYAVEVRYRPLEENGDAEGEGDLQAGLLFSADELLRSQNGDILVFLSGEREIRECAETLRKGLRTDCEVLPLFSRLGARDQERIFHPNGKRRIVLATNIAETSLTVPGIRCVIDSGLARISRYSPRGKIQRLPVERISRASADQRAGRCGRLGPGICIRLYSEDDYQERPQFTDPEILRTNLAAVILQMKALKLGEMEDFPFLEAPDSRLIRDGLKLLEELNAIDANRNLSEIGRNLSRIPLDPRLGRIVLAANQENCLNEIAIIASALSIQDPRERPAEKSQAADEKHRQFHEPLSDFLSILKLWNTVEAKREELSNARFRVYCRENFLSWRRLREWRDIVLQLTRIIQSELGYRVNQLPAAYESIHKALLSGFLSQIGFLKEQSEYLGARNLKFAIHPGSGLFKARPKWIVAAEQVETGRVYARNVASVQPDWIETVGAHLIRLEHYDPHWQKSQARVAVHERSTLFGLVLQSSRKIPYERIDAAGAREIFIRCALVAQEFECNARFFKHNQTLLEELSLLQQKGRRVDLIADDEVLFDFFDARIPESVVDGNSFNRWRREIERTQPDLLLLTREILCGAQDRNLAIEQFPDQLSIGQTTLKLAYRFEPGHADDGVTAIIPIQQLNQLSAESFEWLVPGLLNEKVIALIKALPKSLRRNFVPASEHAERFLARADRRESLLKSLAAWLSDQKSIKVSVEQWFDVQFPDYLNMNFRIVDEKDQTLASGRNLQDLRLRFARDSKQVFHSLAKRQGLQTGATRWEFGEIPKQQILSNSSARTLAYPALVDEGESVGLRLFDSEQAQQSAHELGLARLFLLQLRNEVKYLKQKLRAPRAIAFIYATLASDSSQSKGVSSEKHNFEEDLLQATVRSIFLDDQPAIYNEQDFQKRLAEHKRLLVESAQQLFQTLCELIQMLSEMDSKLAGARLNPESLADIRDQRSRLVPAGFMRKTPVARLKSFPRYFKAMLHRIEKAQADPARDLKQFHEIKPLWSAYWNFVESNPHGVTPEHDDYRWRLEELRVSLFAQNLKTAYPVSCKRLEKLWEARC